MFRLGNLCQSLWGGLGGNGEGRIVLVFLTPLWRSISITEEFAKPSVKVTLVLDTARWPAIAIPHTEFVHSTWTQRARTVLESFSPDPWAETLNYRILAYMPHIDILLILEASSLG